MKHFAILLFAVAPAVAWPKPENTCWVSAHRCVGSPATAFFDDPRTERCCRRIGHHMCECGRKKDAELYCDSIQLGWMDKFIECCSPPAPGVYPHGPVIERCLFHEPFQNLSNIDLNHLPEALKPTTL
ncbi:hypothetical protein PTTW11_11348 [Pyrenophora teres f. teres]|uniref:Uncharacterized protein n=1 Tax=Pyrenophora teres f. teres TaxID=97479 RepID=A0A6S6WFZ5_9PLEO|nr:hypothetical protein PTTW11_11348 [Pyrenophora teres f. teres]